jgi:hypothetical protein
MSFVTSGREEMVLFLPTQIHLLIVIDKAMKN